ncbi:MAG: cyclodeaminase/cyclohydrolase family protein [Synergistaceae bacterium]|jgi:formiminotetrahydrofolate cyclodeaminase|nr:cyclodeaminase/cyclohydrolase family protein [Synergistaceae bacterium]
MKFSKLSCEEFVEILASKEAVPGGGGASSLVGAIGMALGGMVGSLTLGKKKYAAVQEDILALKAKADVIQADLIALIQRDAEVFEPLSKAYGMPSGTENEKTEKERVMAAALKECCAIPLQIMKKCCDAIELHKEFASKGTAIAISDVGCGVACCKAALQAASLNVFINTKSMADRELAEENNKLANEMLNVYSRLADEIYADVAAIFQRR